MAFIQHALALEPNNPSYLATRARLEYALGDVPAAIATLSHAIELDSDHEPGYLETLSYYMDVLQLHAHGPAAGKAATTTAPP